MIKADEDKFMLQKIRRYFLSKGALPFEKDAYLFIDKLFQTIQSKEQEPKGSEECNCGDEACWKCYPLEKTNP